MTPVAKSETLKAGGWVGSTGLSAHLDTVPRQDRRNIWKAPTMPTASATHASHRSCIIDYMSPPKGGTMAVGPRAFILSERVVLYAKVSVATFAFAASLQKTLLQVFYQTSKLSPLVFLVFFPLGTIFNEKSTCLTP